jgi:hypothetical protein
MPVDMHAVEEFITFLVSLAPGAKHAYFVTSTVERSRLFPDTAVEGDGDVFNNDEDLFCH